MIITPGVRAALEECKRLSDIDGFEHAIGLRNDKQLWIAHGNEHQVDTGEFADLTRRGDTIVHSHADSLNALSNGDLYSANHAGVIAYCITRDGSIYRADSTEPPLGILEARWESANGYFSHRALHIYSDGALQRGQQAHWINRMLAGAGYIKYDYELQPETQAMVDWIDREIGFIAK